MGLKLESTPSVAGEEAAPATLDLSINGMSCANCVRHVREAIESVPGVERAEVELETGSAAVHWQPGAALDQGAVFRAVREAGYEPQVQAVPQTELAVEGMTCSGCARNVTEALRAIPGVASVDVQLDAG